MTALGQVLIVMSVLACGIIYGTDVFSAIVLRPALALVDDRTLVSAMGRVHDFGDRQAARARCSGYRYRYRGNCGGRLGWAPGRDDRRNHRGAPHWRAGSSFTLGSVPPSTPGLPPPLNEKNFRLMPGCFSNDGTASSPPRSGLQMLAILALCTVLITS